MLSEESMASLPQVPQPHTYTTLSNLGSPTTQAGSRQLLTVVEGLMERLSRGGHRVHRGRDADVDIDLSYE